MLPEAAALRSPRTLLPEDDSRRCSADITMFHSMKKPKLHSDISGARHDRQDWEPSEWMAERGVKTISNPVEARRVEGSLESLIGYHVRRASLVDIAGVMASLAEANIRPVPLSVLAMIVEKPGVTAAEICRQLAIQRANIVPILADLESRGLFVREADPEDQRIQRLHATKAGRANYADWLARIQAHEEHLLRRLTAAERAILRELLEKIWREY